MHGTILNKLAEIEQATHVKILHAIESGSRAWGFASPDSDYDVRFIYVRDEKDYLRLENAKDTIEWQMDNILDINGWDIRKYLRLIQNSNFTAFEWGNSPMVYRTTEAWENMFTKAQYCFSPKRVAYGYYGLAQKNYQLHLQGDNVSYKKYLYSLRPIFACRYIIREKMIPPVDFLDLIKGLEDEALRKEFLTLMQRKMACSEVTIQPRVPAIDAFIARELENIKNELHRMPNEVANDWRILNELFYNLVVNI